MPQRPAGGGWLVLLGGGEFTFEETLDADAAWEEKAAPGPVGFVPAASGSQDYAEHFTEYMLEVFGRDTVTVPIYRPRDGRRGKNAERVRETPVVYLGGGVADHLLDALRGSPVAEALVEHLAGGAVVVAIAAAAQAVGQAARSIRVGETVPGLAWLPGGVVEPNFVPGHERRLRRLFRAPGVTWGLGIASGSAVLLGPDGAVEVIGDAWFLDDSEGDLQFLGEDDPEGTAPDGTAPDGTAPDGTAPDGTAPEGTAPDGTALEGDLPEDESSEDEGS